MIPDQTGQDKIIPLETRQDKTGLAKGRSVAIVVAGGGVMNNIQLPDAITPTTLFLACESPDRSDPYATAARIYSSNESLSLQPRGRWMVEMTALGKLRLLSTDCSDWTEEQVTGQIKVI